MKQAQLKEQRLEQQMNQAHRLAPATPAKPARQATPVEKRMG